MILAGPRHDVLILSILGNDFVHWVRRAKKKTTGFVKPLTPIRNTSTKLFMHSSPPSLQRAHDVPFYYSARLPNGDTIIATTTSPNELAGTSTILPATLALFFPAPPTCAQCLCATTGCTFIATQNQPGHNYGHASCVMRSQSLLVIVVRPLRHLASKPRTCLPATHPLLRSSKKHLLRGRKKIRSSTLVKCHARKRNPAE